MKKLINEFGYVGAVLVIGMVGFSVVWWVKEIGDFLINN